MKSPQNLLQFPRLSFVVAFAGACLAPASLHAVVTLNSTGNTADRTADINTAIGNARAAGDYLMLNAGTYYHSGEITISGAVEVRGAGDSTILLSTTPEPITGSNPKNGTVRLTGTGPKLRNIRVQSTWTGPFIHTDDGSSGRSQADLSTLVYMKDAISFLVENVTAENSKGSGMIVTTGSRGTASSSKAKIINCRVRNTMADGIHITAAVKWVSVENCNVSNVGDDMIAIVSKRATGVVTTDMSILNNTVSNNYWGRGITVVGGTNVVIRGNTITKANGSGILLASDNYDTHGVSGITAENNTITDPNNAVRSGQNGITLEGINKDSLIRKVTSVTLTNNTITNARGRGVVIGRYTENITLRNMKIDKTSAAGVELTSGDTATSSYPKNITITGDSNTASYIKNTGAQGVSAPKTNGTLKIEKTGFSGINTSGTANTDVVRVVNNDSLTANIINNHYSSPSSAGGIRNFIRCEEPTYTPKPVTNNNGNTLGSGVTTTSFWAP